MTIEEIIDEVKKLSLDNRRQFDSIRLCDEDYGLRDKIIILDNSNLIKVMHNDRYREEMQREKFGIPKNENNKLHGSDSLLISLKSKSFDKKTKKGKYSITPKTPLAEMGRICTYKDVLSNPDCKDTITTLYNGAKEVLNLKIFKDDNFIQLFKDQQILKSAKLKVKSNERDSFFLNFYLIKKYNIKFEILDFHEDTIFNLK